MLNAVTLSAQMSGNTIEIAETERWFADEVDVNVSCAFFCSSTKTVILQRLLTPAIAIGCDDATWSYVSAHGLSISLSAVVTHCHVLCVARRSDIGEVRGRSGDRG
jgi:hypothetical protein